MASWNLERVMLINKVEYQRVLDEVAALKSKSTKQRNEIARLTQAIDTVTQEKRLLLDDIKYLKGELH